MDSINKTYHLEIEVLSPLHVGGGAEKDWVKEVDFVYDDKKVYKLNNKKVIENIGVEKYTSILLNRNNGTLKNSISGHLKDLSDSDFEMPHTSPNPIKAFIKTGLENKPYIPGSSIKGAIRSILLNHFKPDKAIDKNNILNDKYFGSSTKGDEFMRFVKLSDVHFKKTELVNTKIFNLTGNGDNIRSGWKHEGKEGTTNKFKPYAFNTIYEIIPQGELGIMTILLAEKQFDNFDLKNYYENEKLEAKKNRDEQKRNQDLNRIRSLVNTLDIKNKVIENDIEFLFELINKSTISYIKKELAFYKKYNQAEKCDKIIESYEYILKTIPNNSLFAVMHMSAGSGFHSITGDWKFEDSHDIDKTSVQFEKSGKLITKSRGTLNGKESAKSRKIAISGENFMPMGFVKLSLIDQAEIDRRKLEKKLKFELEQKEKDEQERKEAAEKERIEAEKRLKQEAIEKAKVERIAEEKRIIEEREAALKKAVEQEKEAQERNRLKREAEDKSLQSEGLSSLSGKSSFKDGKQILKKYLEVQNIKTITNTVQLSYLKDFVLHCIEKEKRNWKEFGKGDWYEIVKCVPMETSQAWFSEIIGK